MSKKKIFAASLVVALALGGCHKEAGEAPAREYASMKVEKSALETVERYPATFRGRQDVQIIPQVSGKIVSVDVREGQRVKRGQTLFVIDQVPYRAAVLTAQANVEAAKAEVATARLDYDGKQALYAQKVISEHELKKGENTLLAAEAALQQCEAQLTNARNDLSYTVITSPCDGVVGTIPYRAGQLVGPSMTTPLTTVSDNSQIYVYFSIPENRMIGLIRRHGSSEAVLEAMPAVRLFLNDGSEYDAEGYIESMSGVLDAATGSVSLRAVFPNVAGLLHSGGSGNVGIVTTEDAVVLIPQSATYEFQDKVYAYRVTDGRAHAVRLGVRAVPEQRKYVVMSGLEPGDTIITEGVGNLTDGTEVTLK